ncbi:3-deoxy-D-manno-octulosonic acid kinase [Thermomonas sp.]|uniref:3-deoxy-D-manno-octulosonic acid kinase n=1 Tax=Thermomonas sp. TaxID=1971895 RepID=UPI002C1CB6E2|nr:3-deoxy-D-manno-octulosonic acid kinase [Thermomonas sp.]HRO63817.1 3-deoxy-D-manno-octulosonic acid kinase [Thermomonas sp.]
MAHLDPNEHLTPFHDAHGYGAVLFDRSKVRQPDPAWFDPAHWGEAAQPVAGSGRGGAWFLDLGEGEAFLRHYLRGGLIARFNRDKHLWRGIQYARSFSEFRLLRQLRAKKLPVPMAYAAWYRREGLQYRAAILMQRIPNVRSLAELAGSEDVPWEAVGQLVARFHRAGVDHADLNAHNLLFDARWHGWMIDFDRSRVRIIASGWREANLLRLRRSLRKVRGRRSVAAVDADFARLREGYEKAWEKGI